MIYVTSDKKGLNILENDLNEEIFHWKTPNVNGLTFFQLFGKISVSKLKISVPKLKIN
jgi:hypothetical protein